MPALKSTGATPKSLAMWGKEVEMMVPSRSWMKKPKKMKRGTNAEDRA